MPSRNGSNSLIGRPRFSRHQRTPISMRINIFLLATLTVAPSLASAQTVPTRVLATPEAEWSDPFSSVNGLRELRDGRVIVSDNREKTLQLIDFKGSATKIGREGSGPGEFGLPVSVYAAPGDTTWVFDLLNSRFLVIDPNGKPVSTFVTSDVTSATTPQVTTATPTAGRSGGGP